MIRVVFQDIDNLKELEKVEVEETVRFIQIDLSNLEKQQACSPSIIARPSDLSDK